MNILFLHVTLSPRRLAVSLALVLALAGTMALLGACNNATFPIEITALSASGEPLVGHVVTLTVEIESSEDGPNTTLEVQLPKGMRLVGGPEPFGGQAVWQGSLTANQPQRFDVPVCVLYEGDWMVYVAAWYPITDTANNFDHATVHFISSADSARVVPGSQYAASPQLTYSPPRTPLPETPPPGICP